MKINNPSHLYAPLYEVLYKHAESRPVGFHVPGHHYGQAIIDILKSTNEGLQHDWAKELSDTFLPIMKLDATELSATDDLHHPEASIREAQDLAAQYFGADESYFLVGGSTSGNIALILAMCAPGDLIIVQRNVHKSIINGLKLAGATAVFLAPQLDEQTGLATLPSLETVEQALHRYPQAKAVFLSTPNYYGIGKPLSKYVDIVHRFNKPLFIDEAHGAHYSLHSDFPQSAVAAGADAVVQSTHKTLFALTMGAMLHTQGQLILRDELREALAMVQSSSPSFPIMASLDISRAMIEYAGPKLFNQALKAAASFRIWIKDNELSIGVIDMKDHASHADNEDRQSDPLRVLLYAKYGQFTGFELQRELEQFGCWVEMSDPVYTVLIFSVGTTCDEMNRLQDALLQIDLKYDVKSSTEQLSNMRKTAEMLRLSITVNNDSEQLNISDPVPFERNRFKGKSKLRMELAQAVGQVSAEMVIPYPPGIPIVYPGEPITQSMIAQIQQLAAAGAKFQGAEERQLHTIAIYE